MRNPFACLVLGLLITGFASYLFEPLVIVVGYFVFLVLLN